MFEFLHTYFPESSILTTVAIESTSTSSESTLTTSTSTTLTSTTSTTTKMVLKILSEIDINYSFCSEKLIKGHNTEGICLNDCWDLFKSYLRDNEIAYNPKKHIKKSFCAYLKSIFVVDQNEDFQERYAHKYSFVLI